MCCSAKLPAGRRANPQPHQPIYPSRPTWGTGRIRLKGAVGLSAVARTCICWPTSGTDPFEVGCLDSSPAPGSRRSQPREPPHRNEWPVSAASCRYPYICGFRRNEVARAFAQYPDEASGRDDSTSHRGVSCPSEIRRFLRDEAVIDGTCHSTQPEVPQRLWVRTIRRHFRGRPGLL